ncbi:hypothetical protein Q3A86_13135 [Streptomyces sp. NBUA17]|uniref:hypothetical protein n=1 Tax=Streptomyces sp. NBUA17 TaxID=3062275 RepID=UPI0037D9FCD3
MGAQAGDVVALLAGHHVAGPQQPLVVHPQPGVVEDQEAGVVPLFERDVDTGGGRRVSQRVVQQYGDRVHDALHRPPLDDHGAHLGVLDPLVPLDPAHGRAHDVGQRGGGPPPGQLVPGEDGVARRGEQHLLREVVDLHQRRVRLVGDVPPYALADGPAEPRRPCHDVVGEAAYGGPGHADRLLPHLLHLPFGVLPQLRDLLLGVLAHPVGGVRRDPVGGGPLLDPYGLHRRGHRAGYRPQPLGQRCPVERRRHHQPAVGARAALPALRRRRDHGGGQVPHALLGRDELQGEAVGVLAQLVGTAPGLFARAPESPGGPDRGHREQRGDGQNQFSHQVLTDLQPSVLKASVWGRRPKRGGPKGGRRPARRRPGAQQAGADRRLRGPPGAGEPATRKTVRAHDMELQDTRGPVRAGVTTTRTRSDPGPRVPSCPELPYPRPAFGVRQRTIPLVLTRRVSLVTMSRKRKRNGAKNTRMGAEALWPKTRLAPRVAAW